MSTIRTDAWITVPECNLTPEEIALVRHLLEREGHSRDEEVQELKVVGRCSCGGCPTVIFHSPGTRKTLSTLAIHAGRTSAGANVGVALQVEDGRLFELEGWSLDGQEPIAWPEISTLRPLKAPLA